MPQAPAPRSFRLRQAPPRVDHMIQRRREQYVVERPVAEGEIFAKALLLVTTDYGTTSRQITREDEMSAEHGARPGEFVRWRTWSEERALPPPEHH